jgi:hypothetical protein
VKRDTLDQAAHIFGHMKLAADGPFAITNDEREHVSVPDVNIT